MSTISNERLESLQRQFKEEGFNDISDSEIMQLVEENVALRKERERAEPVAWKLEFQEAVTDDYSRHCVAFMEEEPPAGPYRDCAEPLYTAPPAPVVPDEIIELLHAARSYVKSCAGSDGHAFGVLRAIDRACRAAMLTPPAPVVGDDNPLPYDPQIAEYEQMMEAELKAAARTAYKVKSELSQMAEKLVRDTTALAVTLSAETDTTPQQFESLAGKAVAPEGWKLVPIEPTPDMREAFHQANEEWEDGGATWSPDHQWSAMLAAAPEPCK